MYYKKGIGVIGLHERKELFRKMGERLREYRTELHYTQETTAELLEMSLTYYGRIERGINGLSLEKMILAYHRLDADPLYLLTGEKRAEMTLDDILKGCPRDKRYEMEQLIKYAVELSKR